jgi:hypothetical protein
MSGGGRRPGRLRKTLSLTTVTSDQVEAGGGLVVIGGCLGEVGGLVGSAKPSR